MSSPTLFIERFMVLRDDKVVYDQPFHKGVNIIRGENSTGKSTVMDLLYYALGGELKEWTEEQELCTHVLVEVALSGRIFCLKREITATGKAAMHFFEGNTDSALHDSRNWFRYPNQRSDSKHSYSEQMFDVLGLPQHKTDFSNNLTMHQILRLIYVDQLTDTTKILNNDPEWDSAVTRKAIGEYLLSIDDLEAHKLRQQLIAANKAYESISGELSAITRVLRREDQVFQASQLKADIADAHAEISRLEASQKEVRLKKLDTLGAEIKERSSSILVKIEALSEERRTLVDEKGATTAERLDTLAFLSSVKERLRSLEHSTITRQEFGDISFEYCPSCLTKLEEAENADTCKLCKQEHSSSSREFAYLQLINELQFQIRESETLLPALESDIDRANSRLPLLDKELSQLKSEYKSLTENADEAEAVLYEIASEIGFFKGQIENLEEKLEFAEKIEDLVDRKEKANEAISKVKDRLKAVEESQADRKVRTYNSIENIAKSLIIADGGYEEAFKDPEEITFDFSKNKMFVNGRSKFSASSMVIMKNSIRAAIFLQSIKDPLMRFPRLMFNDNIEDKGMTPERSHNFQKNLVEICDDQTSDYQLIFTTSMIAPELNKPEYVAGPFYPKGAHTLNLQRRDS